MSLFRRRPPASIPAPAPGTPAGTASRDRGAPDPLAVVTAWHERTKHHGHRYAAALGFLDWDNQPDPFRRHAGAPLLPLPRPQRDTTPPFESIYVPAGAAACQPLSIESLSQLLYDSVALSAWKRHGEAHWSLRVNPSSGNLHPTETWLLLPPLPGLRPAGPHDTPGLFHYAPREHALEERARWPLAPWAALGAALSRGAPSQDTLSQGAPASCFLVALSSIPWRESWKYGERAWRYCQHDAGHALAALRISAATLGWSVTCLSAQDDEALAALLGLDRAGDFPEGEPEHPDLLALVSCGPPRAACGRPPRDTLGALTRGAQWFGSPNRLSAEHHEWNAIAIAEATCRKTVAWSDAQTLASAPAALDTLPADGAPVVPRAVAAAASAPCGRSAGSVIRARRSAVAMDGSTGLTARGFCAMLERLVPALTPQPWDAQDWEPLVSLALFVHRVRDVDPGLYALVRTPRHAAALRAALDPAFVWQQPPAVVAAGSALPLFLLRTADARNLATAVSCGQDIAGRGAFSLGMLAEFAPALARHGAPVYRHMFWETGMIGQVLYLEAEAAGIASTGIGCFFDDAMHQALGLRDRSFQSLYHFTVGGAVIDTRLTTEPAYPGPGVP